MVTVVTAPLTASASNRALGAALGGGTGDLAASGSYEPQGLPAPSATARIDGYTEQANSSHAGTCRSADTDAVRPGLPLEIRNDQHGS
ncbi:hypothetical protein [Streptomyces canus]|uniref:Uncharacterized protein n=1 Tax=Streptomyces canus TaxID=58343 RepID=A0AAW8FTY5_9ACTN|nr:hypothetical protein [Streptomyces canus]MDQ0913399.1 hypothetical protein [Streptomyces canus]MDQ1073347.1 hypothetical protein [Streptomyces canus]